MFESLESRRRFIPADYPKTVIVAACLLLGAGLLNLGTVVESLIGLAGQGYSSAVSTVYVVLFTIFGLALGIMPILIGWRGIRRSYWAGPWSILFFVAQFLIAVQNMSVWGYLAALLGAVALILLWLRSSRKYAQA